MLVVFLLLAACASQPASDSGGLVAVTAVPAQNTDDPEALCKSVEERWEQDWPRVIRELEALAELDVECAGTDESNRVRLVAAYLAYGDALDEDGNRDGASQYYMAASRLDPDDPAVIARLQSLQLATAGPGADCDRIADDSALAAYEPPEEGAYVTMGETGFFLFDQPLTLFGINYVPRDFSSEQVLTDTSVSNIGIELDLMQGAGINALRIGLRNDQLFACEDGLSSPIMANFTRLDRLIHDMAERGYKLILVLNEGQGPDLYESPIVLDQMAFVARRYRDEVAVMAYDLRSRGDSDYGDDPAMRETVLAWLATAASVVRKNAPDQLVTAGWDNDAQLTAPLVDFVSFQTGGNVDALRQEIAIITNQTQKPVVLAWVGYQTATLTEIEQRDALFRALEAVQQNKLAGWIIYTAFDHRVPADCDGEPCEVGPESRYGLWNTSYYPKRALDVVRLATGLITREELESQ